MRTLAGLIALGVGLLFPITADAQVSLAYGMDETSGSVMAGTGGAPNGAINGDVNLGVPGHDGTAYSFNQDVGACSSTFNITGTGFVKIPSSSVFAVGAQPFNFGLWLRTTTVPGADSGITKDCDFDVIRRSAQWKMELVPKGLIPFGVPRCAWKGVVNGSSVSVTLTASGSDVTDGAWHQVECGRTSDGEQVIVDGSVGASSTKNVGSITSTSPIYVGRNPAGADYYEGKLDELTFNVG